MIGGTVSKVERVAFLVMLTVGAVIVVVDEKITDETEKNAKNKEKDGREFIPLPLLVWEGGRDTGDGLFFLFFLAHIFFYNECLAF